VSSGWGGTWVLSQSGSLAVTQCGARWHIPAPRIGARSGGYLSDDLGQAGVAQHQPAAWGDPVGLVLELFGLNLVEIFEAAERGSEGAGLKMQSGLSPTLPRAQGGTQQQNTETKGGNSLVLPAMGIGAGERRDFWFRGERGSENPAQSLCEQQISGLSNPVTTHSLRHRLAWMSAAPNNAREARHHPGQSSPPPLDRHANHKHSLPPPPTQPCVTVYKMHRSHSPRLTSTAPSKPTT